MLKIRCQFIVIFFSAYVGFVPRATVRPPNLLLLGILLSSTKFLKYALLYYNTETLHAVF